MSAISSASSMIDEFPVVATGVESGLVWTLYETDDINNQSHNLFVHPDVSSASWCDRVLILAAEPGQAPAKLTEDSFAALMVADLNKAITVLHNGRRAPLYEKEYIKIALGAMLWERVVAGVYCHDGYEMETWSLLRNHSIDHVRSVFFTDALTPVQTWLSMYAATDHQYMSLELIADIIRAGDEYPIRGGALPELSPMNAFSLLLPVRLDKATVLRLDCHRGINDMVWWYIYRMSAIYLSKAPNRIPELGLAPDHIAETVAGQDWVYDDGTGDSANVCVCSCQPDDRVPRIMSRPRLRDHTGVLPWNDYELFTAPEDVRPVLLNGTVLLSSDQHRLVSLINTLLAARDLTTTEDDVHLDIAFLERDCPEFAYPATVFGNRQAFIPLPRGAFEVMASIFTDSGETHAARRLLCAGAVPGLTLDELIGERGVMAAPKVRRNSSNPGTVAVFDVVPEVEMGNFLISVGKTWGIDTDDASAQKVRQEQLEEMMNIVTEFEPVIGSAFIHLGSRTFKNFVYDEYRRRVLADVRSCFTSPDPTPLLWHLRLNGHDAQLEN